MCLASGHKVVACCVHPFPFYCQARHQGGRKLWEWHLMKQTIPLPVWVFKGFMLRSSLKDSYQLGPTGTRWVNYVERKVPPKKAAPHLRLDWTSPHLPNLFSLQPDGSIIIFLAPLNPKALPLCIYKQNCERNLTCFKRCTACVGTRLFSAWQVVTADSKNKAIPYLVHSA